MIRLGFAALACAALLQASAPILANDATIVVEARAAGTPISPHMYGVFFEDINYAADGGLYAELVENRSFEYFPRHGQGMGQANKPYLHHTLFAWSGVERDGGKVRLHRAFEKPIHPNNTTYVDVVLWGDGGTAGLSNNPQGQGMPLVAGDDYDFSCYARWIDGEAKELIATLEAPDGAVLASATLPAPSMEWTKLSATLACKKYEPHARLVLTTPGKGRLALDMISLFPQKTFKDRPGGLRKDLAQAIADLKPKTLRFPGGCIVHGTGLDNAYRWKDTVGDVAKRRKNFNRWGYHQSYGLGYFEYMQFAKDIGAEPLPILPCGVSCGFELPYEVAQGVELQEYIQDALDLIEFANGPVDSKWGRVRAEMGRSEPFALKLLGIGNEEDDTQEFRELFPMFVDAVRAKHPEIEIVGTSGLGPGLPLFDLMRKCDVPISDEHYYEAPEWFINNQHRFDNLPRTSPKVYVGEYASRGNTLFNAVAEAAYLTGIERNADQVVMTAYAPLLARYDFTQWGAANLIWFDTQDVVLTPNYHVQRLFSTHAGDRYVPTKAEGEGAEVLAVSCTKDDATGELYLKIVNTSDRAMEATVELQGAKPASEAERILLAGDRDAVNDRQSPNRVAPVSSMVPAGPKMAVQAPPTSVQLVRVPMAK